MFGILLAILTIPHALADDDTPEQPVTPYNCEAWQAHVDDLLASDDALEHDLGSLYDEPAMRYCKLERTRVARFDWDREREGIDLPDFAVLGDLLRILVIAALLGVFLWLLWRWRHVMIDLGRIATPARTDPIPPPVRAPLQEPGALPSDIPAAARRAWRDGDARGALSLLYRGAVSALLPERGGRQAYTEREVLRQLKAGTHGRERLAYMRRLVDQWLLTAWAERPPGAGEFDALCREWPAHCRGEP